MEPVGNLGDGRLPPLHPEPFATFLATREDIRHFAVAIGETAAVHHDVEAARAQGYRDLLAPAFYFCKLGLSLGRVLPSDQLRDDGLPRQDELPGRVVMGGESVRWYGHIVAGDEVGVRQVLESRRSVTLRGGPAQIFVYRRMYSVADTLVVSERITRIGRR